MTRAPGGRDVIRQSADEARRAANRTSTLEVPTDEKDDTERKLEELLFGNETGFLNSLSDRRQELAFLDDYESDASAEGEGDTLDENEGDEGNGLQNDDLFMIDVSGDAGTVPSTALVSVEKRDEEEDEQAAWEDSDDERLTVSLASNSRLRKLRYTEADDFITGREYARRLREQYERLHPTPEWAQQASHRKKRRRVAQNLDDEGSEVSISDEDEDMDDDDIIAQPLAKLLQSAESLTDSGTAINAGKIRPLRSGTIDVQRLPDVGNKQPSAVRSLSFHPTVSPPLLLSAGPSGLISMHHISTVTSSASRTATNNPLLTSLAVPRLPIETSTFHPSGTRIFFAGRRRYFHIWDLPSGSVSRVSRVGGNQETQRSCERFKLSPCGRFMALVGTAKKGGGVANILDATTGQWIAQARVEGQYGVSDLEWWTNGDGLAILAKSGEVVEYSVKEKRAVARWTDAGAYGSTVIAMGGKIPGMSSSAKKPGLGPDRWVAIGSQSGIVNIYDRAQWKREKMDKAPSPRKALSHLVTPTSHLHFSPDGQLLVMASQGKKDALKLVHLPSCTVYKNWPTSNSPLGIVTSIAWTANGQVLAVGDERGKIRLWQIRG